MCRPRGGRSEEPQESPHAEGREGSPRHERKSHQQVSIRRRAPLRGGDNRAPSGSSEEGRPGQRRAGRGVRRDGWGETQEAAPSPWRDESAIKGARGPGPQRGPLGRRQRACGGPRGILGSRSAPGVSLAVVALPCGVSPSLLPR